MRVCVVKVGGLGDTLSVAPLVAALVDGGLEVVILGGPAAVLLPAPAVSVPRTALSGPLGLRHVPRLARRLGRCDVALVSADECTAAHAVAARIARRRIGFAAGIAKGQALLTERLPFDAARPVADLALDLGRVLLGPVALRRWAPGPRTVGDCGVLHAGAATALQRWPGFEALAARGDLPWRRVDEADGLSLDDLARVIGGGRVFVGCHSGPLHLAAALGVPHVAVAGPTAPAWDPPWPEVPGRILRVGLACQPCGRFGQPARTCAQAAPPPPCLTAWTADAVAAAVADVLAEAADA